MSPSDKPVINIFPERSQEMSQCNFHGEKLVIDLQSTSDNLLDDVTFSIFATGGFSEC